VFLTTRTISFGQTLSNLFDVIFIDFSLKRHFVVFGPEGSPFVGGEYYGWPFQHTFRFRYNDFTMIRKHSLPIGISFEATGNHCADAKRAVRSWGEDMSLVHFLSQ
jgi:hypothetical protein